MYAESRTFRLEMDSATGALAIRASTMTLKNGVPVGPAAHHRVVLAPDADLSAVPVSPGETAALPADIAAQVSLWWSPERIQQYQDRLANAAES